MTHPNKVKGNTYERELVNQAKEKDLEAKRAWASDGRSLGLHEEVDLVVSGQKIQAKRRKKLLKGIQDMIEMLEHTDAVVFRQDKGTSHVLIPWSDYLELLANEKAAESRVSSGEREMLQQDVRELSVERRDEERKG